MLSAKAASSCIASMLSITVPNMCMSCDNLCCLQDANKEGETPLSLAGDLAAALQEASSSGKLFTNGFGAMEH